MSIPSYQIQNRIENYLGRYEFVEGNSAKFWECLKDGDNPGKYATRWGAIKATKTKNNIKANMDLGEAAKKISEKIGKGYQFVDHNPNDVMNLRVASEEAEQMKKSTPPIKDEIVPVSGPEPAAPTRRRL